MYYVVPRLCGIGLNKANLAKALAVVWNVAIVIGILMIMNGDTQAREYAELPWIMDVAVMALLILNGYVVISTIMKRSERKLYASLWFYALIWLVFPVVYFVGNVMWNPPTGALTGLVDAVFNWFYGHNVLGLWFTPFGIALWYYFIPKLINKPLYSMTLSLISFFSLAFFYTGVGAHHILQAPIPDWLKDVAVITSILMMFSVLTFGANIGMTMRRSWHHVLNSVPLRFIIFGFICYVLVSIQGSFQSLQSMNLYLHFSQWPVGHAHLALLGAFGFAVVGAMFWLIPRITKRALYSQRLMNATWWIAFIGFVIFFIAMTIAGLVQNSDWFVHMTIAQTLPVLTPYFVLRAIGGGVVVVAAYLFAINMIMTLINKKPFVPETETAGQAEPAMPAKQPEPALPAPPTVAKLSLMEDSK
jgi:cytochrome c oxidase cbb3-type subunit I/II